MKFIGIIFGAALISSSALALEVNHYGIFKGVIKTTKGLENNYKAFKAGGDSKKATHFSFKQSRWGMRFSGDMNLSAQLEFDFDGQAGNSNGPVSGFMRVRLVNINYDLLGTGKLSVGKMWTKFMGVLPHTYSITMVNFGTGNTGFIVDGASYTHKFGNLSLAFEMSNYQGDNSGASGTTSVQAVSTPIQTLAVDYKGREVTLGAAYTQGKLKHSEVSINKDENSAGAKIYGSFKMFDNLDVRGEYYIGENLGDLHAGGIVSSKDRMNATKAIKHKERGFFLSAKYQFRKTGIFASTGKAEFNKDNGLKIDGEARTMQRLGLDYKLEKKLMAFIEYKSYKTKISRYVGSATSEDDKKGQIIDVGLMYKF